MQVQPIRLPGRWGFQGRCKPVQPAAGWVSKTGFWLNQLHWLAIRRHAGAQRSREAAKQMDVSAARSGANSRSNAACSGCEERTGDARLPCLAPVVKACIHEGMAGHVATAWRVGVAPSPQHGLAGWRCCRRQCLVRQQQRQRPENTGGWQSHVSAPASCANHTWMHWEFNRWQCASDNRSFPPVLGTHGAGCNRATGYRLQEAEGRGDGSCWACSLPASEGAARSQAGMSCLHSIPAVTSALDESSQA